MGAKIKKGDLVEVISGPSQERGGYKGKQGHGEAVLRERDPTRAIPPLAGALVKNEQDVMLFEKLAFMARRQGS